MGGGQVRHLVVGGMVFLSNNACDSRYFTIHLVILGSNCSVQVTLTYFKSTPAVIHQQQDQLQSFNQHGSTQDHHRYRPGISDHIPALTSTWLIPSSGRRRYSGHASRFLSTPRGTRSPSRIRYIRKHRCKELSSKCSLPVLPNREGNCF